MRSAKGISLVWSAAVLVILLACGGETPGITDPDPITKEKPTTVDTAAVRIAAVNALLTEINGAISALNASASAGGVPTGSPPPSVVGDGSNIVGARATFGVGDPPPPDAAKCDYDATLIRWNCPDFVQTNGLTIKTWFQFLDAANAPMKDLDTAKTIGIRRVSEKAGVTTGMHGTPTGPVPAVDTMKNTDDLVLTGLKSPPADRRLNGTGTMNVVIVPEGQPVAKITATTTTANFAMAQTATARYPIAGTITAIVTSIRMSTPPTTSTTTQVTTYDGSKIAKLVIQLPGGNRTCTWDMTLTAAPVCTGP